MNKAANEFRLQVGRGVIGVVCPTPEYIESMENYFGVKCCEESSQVRLILDIVSHDDLPQLAQSLFTTKKLTADGFTISDDLVRGRFKGDSEVQVEVKAVLTAGQTTRVFEQLLYQAFYSTKTTLGFDAFLIHASGVIHDGIGFLFVGESESGKSTIADLSQDDIVLNDEICLVEFDETDVYVSSTPFNGYYHKKQNGRAMLAATLLIAHGEKPILQKIPRSDAVSILISQIVPMVGLEDEIKMETRLQMLDIADRLSSMVPFRRMEFSKDSGFWLNIDSEFSLKGERKKGG